MESAKKRRAMTVSMGGARRDVSKPTVYRCVCPLKADLGENRLGTSSQKGGCYLVECDILELVL